MKAEQGRPVRARRKHRHSMFLLMIWAFVGVIFMGVCGMGTTFMVSRFATNGAPWAQRPSEATPPVILVDGTRIPLPNGVTAADFRDTWNWQGPVSILLAFSAALIGGATFFSRRVTRPLTRLTYAAQTMAGGDLNVRVGSSVVKEIDELAGAFNTMATSLSDADRQRRQMTADVAHELRTPLSIIRGRLEGMQDGIYKATPEEIATLLKETALLERLIEDLRVLALADAGQLALHKEGIAPGALVRSVAQSFARQAASQNVELRVADVGEMEALPEIDVDPQRIAQVLGNLVANSLRHTPAGGSVDMKAWLEVRAGKNVLCMSVKDTGSGISAEDLPHIFDRFYRVDHARTRSAGGAGLGLAIAKRMIEAHNGGMWAESKPGEGTLVGVWVPVGNDLPC